MSARYLWKDAAWRKIRGVKDEAQQNEGDETKEQARKKYKPLSRDNSSFRIHLLGVDTGRIIRRPVIKNALSAIILTLPRG